MHRNETFADSYIRNDSLFVPGTFGSLMPGRTYSSSTYRYGFNGKENDNEIKGVGNWQDYGMRMYDPRLGRFPSIDPITKEYPELTPYQFASNMPIHSIDLDGLESAYYLIVVHLKNGKTLVTIKNTEGTVVGNSHRKEDVFYRIDKYEGKEGYILSVGYTRKEFFSMAYFHKVNEHPKMPKTSYMKDVFSVFEHAELKNKESILVKEPGAGGTANTDDPFGAFTGGTNPQKSNSAHGTGTADPYGGGGITSSGGTAEIEKGRVDAGENWRTDTNGYYIYTNKQTGDTVQKRNKITDELVKKGSPEEAIFNKKVYKK